MRDITPPPDGDQDFPTLALLHLEGRADPLQRVELERRLLTDPAAPAQLAQLAEMHALLSEAGQAGLLRLRSSVRTSTDRRVRKPTNWAPLAAGLAAAVLVIAIVASRITSPSGAPATAIALRASAGSALLRGGSTLALTEGTALRPDDTLAIPDHGSARLRFADGSEIELSSSTTLHWAANSAGTHIELARGRVVAEIAPQIVGRPFITTSKHTTVTVLGTRFSLTTDDELSAVTVDHGSVKVTEPRFGAVAVLTDGQRLVGDGNHLFRTDATIRPTTQGSGLIGEYFDRDDLTEPRFSRLDPQIAFDWGRQAPDPRLAPETFSVRWTGSLLPAFSEIYTFGVTIDDGARLWIDGKLVIDEWHLSEPQEYSGTIALEAGRLHAIRLEYFQRPALAQVTLRWSSASQSREVVPTARLYPLTNSR